MRYKTFAVILFTACMLLGCGPNEGILKAGKDTPEAVNSAPAKPPLEREIDAMRTAGFSFIYVLQRKDGGKLDTDDRVAIKMQTAEANRRVGTDDGLAIIIGSNTQIPAEKMKTLSERFAIDDHSAGAAGDSNSNVKK